MIKLMLHNVVLSYIVQFDVYLRTLKFAVTKNLHILINWQTPRTVFLSPLGASGTQGQVFPVK